MAVNKTTNLDYKWYAGSFMRYVLANLSRGQNPKWSEPVVEKLYLYNYNEKFQLSIKPEYENWLRILVHIEPEHTLTTMLVCKAWFASMLGIVELKENETLRTFIRDFLPTESKIKMNLTAEINFGFARNLDRLENQIAIFIHNKLLPHYPGFESFQTAALSITKQSTSHAFASIVARTLLCQRLYLQKDAPQRELDESTAQVYVKLISHLVSLNEMSAAIDAFAILKRSGKNLSVKYCRTLLEVKILRTKNLDRAIQLLKKMTSAFGSSPYQLYDNYAKLRDRILLEVKDLNQAKILLENLIKVFEPISSDILNDYIQSRCMLFEKMVNAREWDLATEYAQLLTTVPFDGPRRLAPSLQFSINANLYNTIQQHLLKKEDVTEARNLLEKLIQNFKSPSNETTSQFKKTRYALLDKMIQTDQHEQAMAYALTLTDMPAVDHCLTAISQKKVLESTLETLNALHQLMKKTGL